MPAPRTIDAIKAFLGYLLLGHVALGLHRWVFEPGLSAMSGATQVALVLVNLLAGSWCFVCALRSAWALARRGDEA